MESIAHPRQPRLRASLPPCSLASVQHFKDGTAYATSAGMFYDPTTGPLLGNLSSLPGRCCASSCFLAKHANSSSSGFKYV